VLVCGTRTKSPQHNYRREKFDGTVSAEGKQRWATRPPCGKQRNHGLHTHPRDCDCLDPPNAPESVWSGYLQHRSHLGGYYCTIPLSVLPSMWGGEMDSGK
jgi:hypothetical protein